MQFLDLAGVKQFKDYNDSKYVCTEDALGFGQAISSNIYTKAEIDAMLQNIESGTVTESDPVFTASAASGITSSDITNWNNKTSNVGTITGINMNGSSKGTSGVVDLGTVITSETALSKGTTTGDGNAVTDMSVSGHQITLTKGKTFLESETDPVFSASAAAGISSSDITNWNSKTSNTGTVIGSGLTADKLILGNGTVNVKTSTYGVTTTAPSSTSDDTTIPTSKAINSAIDTALTSVLKYKGTIGTGGTVTSLPASHSVGDIYVVSTASTYAGKACEVGDYIICKTAGTSANDAHWDVVTGENQVDNKSASLAAAGSSATIATVDGTNITVTTPSGWTGVDKTGTVTGVKMNGTTNNPTSGVVDLGTVITSETSLSKGNTSGNGNAVTDISVSGHQITLTKGSTFLTSETQLSKGSTSGSGNVVTDISVSNHQITLTKGATVPVGTSANSGKIPMINSSGEWDYVTPSAIYSGSATPNNNTGNNGDVYLQM